MCPNKKYRDSGALAPGYTSFRLEVIVCTER